MRHDAEADTGPVWAMDDDHRVTRVGKWLRKFRLDELPQMVNVLRGEMSFVGPRPERPWFVAHLKQSIPYYNLRHAVKPGITGWAQVRYQYGASVQETFEKLQYDFFYIKNMSVVLDLTILVETVKTVMAGRGWR
jgi:lipopolysaccharide/colanic/teichoic acid biosynthesis glycosyltransferase